MRELPEPAIKPSELIVPAGVGAGLYTARQVLAIQKQAYEDGLRDAVEDAERYRAIRHAGGRLKIYTYEDDRDPCSGDWLYKPHPEHVDEFADELRAMFTASQKEVK